MPAIRSIRRRLLLATTLLLAAAAADLRAQEVRVPVTIGPFEMADSNRFEQAELGISYTYRNTAERNVTASAYVYPVPAEWLSLPADERIAREAETFRLSLPAGVDRGWYNAFTLPVDTARAWNTADGERPGHLAVAALRRDDGVYISFMHVVMIGDQFVKTRLTMPAEQWRESMAPNFGPDLFALLSAPVSGTR